MNVKQELLDLVTLRETWN